MKYGVYNKRRISFIEKKGNKSKLSLSAHVLDCAEGESLLKINSSDLKGNISPMSKYIVS